MIYTVTLNPAIDYVIKVDNFETGIVNRTKSVFNLLDSNPYLIAFPVNPA